MVSKSVQQNVIDRIEKKVSLIKLLVLKKMKINALIPIEKIAHGAFFNFVIVRILSLGAVAPCPLHALLHNVR